MQKISDMNEPSKDDIDSSQGDDASSTFKIIITSDNHLGYKEKDPEIGNDSFRVFDEVLETASNMNVDFVLLGGDLFHENRPSAETYLKASEIFNKHVFGTPSPTKVLSNE